MQEIDPRPPTADEQLREEVAPLVRPGALPVGTGLPTIRPVAGGLGSAPGPMGPG